ncbi:MAG: hypothetical protein O2820_05240 [Planctomycetota bacterium]|nr:hypothetical protein [Planctomycetota bacterium]MDA1248609.1 hypothetical protein [Planctomycetota bacterium]
MPEYLQDHHSLIYWLAGGSVVMLVLGALFAPAVIARIPADYFVRETRVETRSWHILRIVTRIGKNLLGVLLLVAGILMLILPGQGILTIFAALMLLEFPGKRRLELAIIRQRIVLKAVQWLRQRAGRDPLEMPPTIQPDA